MRRQMAPRYVKALNRIGSYTRTVARRSIKASKGGEPSMPGSKYPKAHGTALKNFLFFKLEKNDTNVVIGPTLLPRPKSNTKPLTVDMPGRAATRLSILMFGGRQLWKSTQGRPSQFRPRYTARPFMQEALKKASSAPRLKEAFRELG